MPSTKKRTTPGIQSMRYSCSVVVGLVGGRTESQDFREVLLVAWFANQTWRLPALLWEFASESHSMSVSWLSFL